jgi:hypothetical protein
MEQSKNKASNKPPNGRRWTVGRAGCTAARSSKQWRSTTVDRTRTGGPRMDERTGDRRAAAGGRGYGQTSSLLTSRRPTGRARSGRAANGAAAAVLGVRSTAAIG